MNSIIRCIEGKKAESYVFLTMGILAVAVAFYFFFGLKESFWKWVDIPFAIVAILEIVVGVTIIARSPKDIVRVKNYIKNDPQKIQTDEIPRMESVIKNFVIFKYSEIVLILKGIILMYALPNYYFWIGIGLGLFMQASIILLLDLLPKAEDTFIWAI